MKNMKWIKKLFEKEESLKDKVIPIIYKKIKEGHPVLDITSTIVFLKKDPHFIVDLRNIEMGKDLETGEDIVNEDIVQQTHEMKVNLEKLEGIAEKAIEKIEDSLKTLQYEKLTALEKEKIQKRELQSKVKERAEREYYGKQKTKRIPLNKELREAVFTKFENECAICGQKEGLHIHHKNKNPSDNRMVNLSLLCGVCHKKAHMNVR